MLSIFYDWWNKPLTAKQKSHAVGIGIFGGFWVGLLSRLLLGPNSGSLIELFYWGIGGAVLGGILGSRFPKVIRIVLFPFSMFGISGGS